MVLLPFNDFAYLLRDEGCGRCGYPLPETVIRRVIRDGDDNEIVKSVLEGSINRIVCPNCNFIGWINSPFLWVDRAKARAVFVTGDKLRHDKIADERTQLIELALRDVDAATREKIERRLQDITYHRDIPDTLDRSDEEAEIEHRALEAFRRRDGLPASSRLERLLRDAVDVGGIVMEGFERSTEFCALIESETAALEATDNSMRAQGLRQICAQVAALAERAVDQDDAPQFPNDRIRAVDVDFFDSALGDYDLPLASHAPETITSALDSVVEEDIQSLVSVLEDQGSTETDRASAARRLAIYNINHRRYQEAAALAKQVVDYARRQDNSYLTEGLILAGMALTRERAAVQAVEYLEEAYQRIIAPQLHDKNATWLGYVYESLGDAHLQRGHLPIAAQCHRAAISIFKQLGRADAVCGNSLSLSGICINLGELAEAEACCRTALAATQPDSEDAVRALVNLAGVLSSQLGRPTMVCDLMFGTAPLEETEKQAAASRGSAVEDHAPSVNLSREAQQAFAEQHVSSELKNQRVVVRTRLNNREGTEPKLLCEMILGDEAVACALAARRIARERGFAELELVTYMQLAGVFSQYQMSDAARDTLELERRRRSELGLPATARTLLALARFWERVAHEAYERSDLPQAHEAWNQVVENCGRARELDRSHGDADRDRYQSASATDLRALALEALGRHAEAALEYRLALGEFEGLRQHLRDSGHKLHLQNQRMIMFTRAARNSLALRSGLPQGTDRDALAREAYRYGEAGRARILLDALDVTSSSISEGTVFACASRPVAIEELTARLPSTTALVQYSLLPNYAGLTGSWAIYTVLPGTGLAPIVIQSDLEEVLGAKNEFYAEIGRIERQLVNARNRGELNGEVFGAVLGDHTKLDEVLERLGALLLPPELISMLRSRAIDRLVLVPESYLFDVPFAALRVRWTETLDYVTGSTPTTGVETLVVPSASAFVAALQRASDGGGTSTLLCVSDPTGDLPDVMDWMENAIISRWPGKRPVHLTRDGATYEAVIDAIQHHGAVIYFGHGVYDPTDTLESGLVLHGEPWRVRSLLDHSVVARLAQCRTFIMLACSGARIDSSSQWEARELLGFSAGLLGSGVANVIGGIWPLWDSFAKEFGASLIDGIVRGLSASAACKRGLSATLVAGGAHANPYIWGAMRVSGAGTMGTIGARP